MDARKADLEAIKNDSEATVGALNAAEMALATAQTALADANTAAAEEMTVSDLVDDAMTATADITDESTLAEVAVGRAAIDAAKESLKGMENLSDDVTMALQGRIDTLESSFSPNEMAVKAYDCQDGSGRDQEDGYSPRRPTRWGWMTPVSVVLARWPSIDDNRLEGAYGLSIERDRMATTVTITVQGATEDDRRRVHSRPWTSVTVDAPCTLVRWKRMKTAMW